MSRTLTTGARYLGKTAMQYSARPDGRMTIEAFVTMIPTDIRSTIEDDLNALMDEGWGELTLLVINKKIAGHRVTLDRRYKVWSK